MFHQKSRGVSLILFSDGVPEMESVEKPNYARHGHGASILDYTIGDRLYDTTWSTGILHRYPK